MAIHYFEFPPHTTLVAFWFEYRLSTPAHHELPFGRLSTHPHFLQVGIGEPFSVSFADAFDDSDTLTYSMSGASLYTWLNIDAGSGAHKWLRFGRLCFFALHTVDQM